MRKGQVWIDCKCSLKWRGEKNAKESENKIKDCFHNQMGFECTQGNKGIFEMPKKYILC
jgi:hypothetical protein